MLKNAASLSDDHEYALVYWGQSNSRPWGWQTEGFAAAPYLDMEDAGYDVTFAGSWTKAATTTFVLTGTLPQVVADRLVGAEFRLGTVDTPKAGYGIVTRNSLTKNAITGVIETATIVVEWQGPFAGAGSTGLDNTATDAWITMPNRRWRSYPQVRVLTPWLPEIAGDYPSGTPNVPGYTLPATIEGWDDVGMFLDFTFLEGLNGPGEVDDAGAAHTISGTGGTIFTRASGTFTAANVYAGGFLRITNQLGQTWRGRVASHTTTAVTVSSWTPAAAPTGSSFTYEIYVDHYLSNPHHEDPGYGFRQPSNDPQPGGISDIGNYARTSPSKLRHRPRGATSYLYEQRFGSMIVAAMRLSLAIGKRVNVIHLGINSSGQYPHVVSNSFGYNAPWGWWDPTKYLDWTPSSPDSNAARLKKLITTVAPAALTMEGSTKTLKILGIIGYQGEADALTEGMRETYKHSLSTFYSWLRGVIVDAGLSAYPDGQKIPVMHAPIHHTPYERDGAFEYYVAALGITVTLPDFNGDADGIVNTAIANFVAKDGAACTIDVSESTKLGDHTFDGTHNADPLHYDGYGEVANGVQAADALALVIDEALERDGVTGSEVVRLCNLALSFLGDAAKVTSVSPSDGSRQATLCGAYYTQARDSLLAMHRWGFATRRVALVEVTNARTEWAYCYACPNDLMNVVYVVPADATDDVINAIELEPNAMVTAVNPRANFVPRDYSLERDDDGCMVIYTNEPNAHVRYQALVSDVSQFPPLFRHALAWHLASMLAGPLLKGDVGTQQAVTCVQRMNAYLAQAKQTDAAQRRMRSRQQVPWVGWR